MSEDQEPSQTASEYIESQLRLEEDAREALPYQFDTCTKSQGPLRQPIFACLTCTPPPATVHQQFTPAGICYSCSISCHGDHNLVELFTKRDFVCDCGTTRFANSNTPCTLRANPSTGLKGGVVGEEAASSNKYDQNYAGKFCGCSEEYDPEKEKGTMFQCLGLGSSDEGGCGEDWWHPECLMGLPRVVKNHEHQDANGGTDVITEGPSRTTNPGEDVHPEGFPEEEDFDHFICYKCVDANPWIKQYAGTAGFLPAVVHSQSVPEASNKKRKIEDDEEAAGKRIKIESGPHPTSSIDESNPVLEKTSPAGKTIPSPENATPAPKFEGTTALHETLPQGSCEQISLFLKEDFRDHFCRCPTCFPRLAKFPQLLEEEDAYMPPLSESDQDDLQSVAGRSVNSGSLLDRGEAALSSMDRVRAIEGVMAYNHVRDKVKSFLAPFAESGKAVGAEDIKAYFAQLRGDQAAAQS